MTQPSVLVLSHHHELLPFANRLRSEGCDVQVAVWRERYEAAWQGMGLKRRLLERDDQPVKTTAEVILSGNARQQFAGQQPVFGVLQSELPPVDPVRFGGWYDCEQVSHRHLLVVDRGAWQGGQGPSVDVCATLVWWDPCALVKWMEPLYEQLSSFMKQHSFRGLFQFDVVEGESGFQIGGVQLGWPRLHTHAFLAELQGFHRLLTDRGVEQPTATYVTALAVSIPPWPNLGQAALNNLKLQGLSQGQVGQFFWHDVKLVDGELLTAGLDGFLGVAIGSSKLTPELARARAQELAWRLDVPDKQYRPDGGATVPAVLATLEERYAG